MLDQRIAGMTFRQIGAAHGISTQAAHEIVTRTGRQHSAEVLANVHDAMNDDPGGGALVLLVPGGSSAERRLVLRYLTYVEEGMRKIGADPELSFHPAGYEGGLAVAIVDRAYRTERTAT
jgi:hypothetical protein